MTPPFVIVGYGRRKHITPRPASEIYRGTYVRCAVRWAHTVTTSDRVLILSAKHGLIRSTTVIGPYDARFTPPIRADDPVVQMVQTQAAELGVTGRTITLAGALYADVLIVATSGRLQPFNPFHAVLDARGENHQQGYQMRAFNASHGTIPGGRP